MGNKNPYCLNPKIEDSYFDINSEYKIKYSPTKNYKRIFKNEEFLFYSNSSCKYKSKKSLFKNKSLTYIDKVKIIQNYFRYYLSVKKFKENIDLLSNILKLDSSVNVIKDKNLENNLLMNNIGEQISLQLMKSKKIISYIYTRYYKININKYKPNIFLIKTPLTYLDKYKNDDLYIGTWTLEKRFHGYGIYYSSGNKCEGFWDLGKLCGEGRKFFKNKDYYIGNFVEGRFNGQGKYFHNDGTIYEGNWLDDQPHGNGKEIFEDGSKFFGIFENGFKKKGRFTWNDGSFYDGEIKKNYFEGYGKYKWKEGKEYIGFWKNGKMNGRGTMSYTDGAMYEGEFLSGKREGKGNYYWNKNKYYKGNWKKGKQEGIGYYFNLGKGIIGIWKGGKIKQCLSQETNNILLFSTLNDKIPDSPKEKYVNNINSKTEYNYDSINISTNLSNNSIRDSKINKKIFKYNSENKSNKTNKKEKYQKKKSIINEKSFTSASIISDYSSSKPKITLTDNLFKQNYNSYRSQKFMKIKKKENMKLKIEGYCNKYKKKK